jgi:Protein of unknown function (DUF1064)
VTGVTKYGNVRTVYRGEVYDSRGEAEYAARLDLLEAAGAIRAWRRGRVWTLLDGPRRCDRITLRPDFEVWDAVEPGGFRCLDCKGVETQAWRLKVRLWRAVYPTIPLYVTRADGSERRVA